MRLLSAYVHYTPWPAAQSDLVQTSFLNMQSVACMQPHIAQRPCIGQRCALRAAKCTVRAASRKSRPTTLATASPQLQPAKRIATSVQPVNNLDSEASVHDQQQSLRWLSPSSLAGGSQVTLLGLAASAFAGVLGTGFELQGPGSVIEALGVLAAIIAVHEWGHFTAARLQNIHVTQFAIGFGPPIVSFKVTIA